MSARLGTLAVGVLLALCALAWPARAQVSIQTQVSANKVEVGQSFQLQITALGSGRAPRDPNLPVPPGIEVNGPSIGTQTQVTMVNGRVTQRLGISATWTLTPTRPGTLRIGPPSVDVGGRRALGEVVSVEVVAQGTLPRAPAPPRAFDPYRWLDPFSGSPFRGPHFGSHPELSEELPPVPEELRVDRAPDPVAFLRAVTTPKRPVVGEQVTLRIYAYASRGPFREANPTEPSRADFLGYSVVESSYGEDFVRVPIGDAVFTAVKLRELALFPLRSGKVVIGPMTMTFDGPRYRSRTPVVRRSEPVELEVTEPPLAGRPPGYKLGDVGELRLTARVDPTRIVAGEGVSVIAKLEGTGNLPLSLNLPEQRGIEWLEPSLTEQVEPDGSVVRGYRTFSYVVKIHTPGRIDLGELKLPHFDPKRRAYAVARAKLGVVDVEPNPAKVAQAGALSSAAAAAEASAASKLPPARRQLGSAPRAAAPFTDNLAFWALLFGTPLAVALGGAGLEFGKRARTRIAARRSDPDRLAADALNEAEAAAQAQRPAEAASAVERALFRAIEAGTGVRARALLRPELVSALEKAGLARTTLDATLALLDACEALRFTKEASAEPPQALVARARATVSELVRRRRSI